MKAVNRTTLSEVCSSVRYGYTASASEEACGPKFLRITDIVPESLDWNRVPFCEISDSDKEKFEVKIDDIVVARTGATVGYAKQIREDVDAVFASYLVRFRVDPAKANPLYIGKLIESAAYKEFVQSRIGGAAQPNASAPVLGAFPFHLPSISIQERAANTLSTYDDLIDNNRRRMALLEDSARQLYREWFVRLRFPGHEHTPIVDGVPQGWKKVRVDELGTVLTGKTPSTKDADNYGSDIQFVKTPDMHGNAFVLQTETYLTEKGAKSQANKFLPPGALLVSCIGTVGVVSLSSELCQFNQQINAVIPMEDFLRYYSYFALKDLKPRLDAIGGGVTMANVSKGKFESMDVLRPTSALLRNFDEFSSPVFNQIKVLGQQNQKLRQARDLLLPRLMNGELAV